MPPSTAPTFYGFESIARLCSRFLIHLFHCPVRHPTIRLKRATLPFFIAYVLYRTQLHSSTVYFALGLIHRLKARLPTIRGTSGHRLFIAAIMIAAKYMYDETYSNKSWAIVARDYFSLREINQMEREMCKFLEWDMVISAARLAAFEKAVVAEYSRVKKHYLDLPQSLLSSRAQADADETVGGGIEASEVFTLLHQDKPKRKKRPAAGITPSRVVRGSQGQVENVEDVSPKSNLSGEVSVSGEPGVASSPDSPSPFCVVDVLVHFSALQDRTFSVVNPSKY
ncbi:hypothetical protein D9611_008877 [Ephemerocybe angulata]|uniref:Cyclin-like domain-containing protein n=1 Tax=Ephemerocybe angulata TaxID=980116 RepID=A0A8H5C0F5_9AGAR|nr:hypothetical protein D9611_008877 [Tulosesus angulatus]